MDVKQILILRKDLNMRKGKMVAQGAHASLAVFLQQALPRGEDPNLLQIVMSEAMKGWVEGAFKKITVSVPGEEELLVLHQKAVDAGLPCALIRDSGLTEFKGVPTLTALAIGPAEGDLLDEITGHLPLL